MRPPDLALVPAATSFEDAAKPVLQALSVSLRRLIADLPDAPRKAAEFTRALGIDAPLGWKVYRVATAADPLSAGGYVPQIAAMNRVVRAARKAGVSKTVLEEVQEALARFEQLVIEHAGSHELFQSMIADYDPEGSKEGLAHRRAAFRANAHLYGLQARCAFGGLIVGPPTEGSPQLDAVGLNGRIAMRQIRRSTEIVCEAELRVSSGKQPAADRMYESLDFNQTAEHGGLLPEFCSEPLPMTERYETADGYWRWRLKARGVGKTAEMTYSAGIIARGSLRLPAAGEPLTYVGRLLCPMEVATRDLVVHEDVVNGCEVFAKVYGGHNGRDHLRLDDTDLLPEQADVVYLGHGVGAAVSPDCPWMDKLVGLATSRMGWDPDRFHVFRCRIEYPVMQSIVRLFVSREPGSKCGARATVR